MLTQHDIPLAERMRPASLDDVVGQQHLLGKQGVLRTFLRKGAIPSMIFWGPPGVGKTTLAMLISASLKAQFVSISALSSSVKDLRDIIEKARFTPRTVLFIDEIHRFSKSQQDSLLQAVEKGIITLIGATTENPSFEVNQALLSRCQVYRLEPLSDADILALYRKAIKQDLHLSRLHIELKETESLIQYAAGDARKALHLLEWSCAALSDLNAEKIIITNAVVQQVAQQALLQYDKKGEKHYDIISAFIKSIRGGDPNAALYWLACMLEGGEDLTFIGRRLLILAAEDIGLANPNALLIAQATFDAVQALGYPEAEIVLAECVVYLALSPKSNSSYMAIKQARQYVRSHGIGEVPLGLRNQLPHTDLAKSKANLYKYSHDYHGHFVQQDFLPPALKGTIWYEPGTNARELEYLNQLCKNWQNWYKYKSNPKNA